MNNAGSAQISNLGDLQAFGIDALVTLTFAALIALHPVRPAVRISTLDFIMPRLFAFHALIGLVVGFLVDQSGNITGFVIFGIGALFCFMTRQSEKKGW